MKLSKASKRDKKLQKRINGHREDGRSVFTIREEQKKRAIEIKKLRKLEEELLEGDLK